MKPQPRIPTALLSTMAIIMPKSGQEFTPMSKRLAAPPSTSRLGLQETQSGARRSCCWYEMVYDSMAPKQKKFKPSDGWDVADGISTISRSSDGTHREEYLSPRKSEPVPYRDLNSKAPMPSFLSFLASSAGAGPSGIRQDEYAGIAERQKVHANIDEQYMKTYTTEGSMTTTAEAIVTDACETGQERRGPSAGKGHSTPIHMVTENFVQKYAQPLLNEFCALEYDADLGKPCFGCFEKQGSNSQVAIYRCRECIAGPLLCAACMIEAHRWLPFHPIEKHNGTFFERLTLFDIGLVLFLGHRGMPCSKAKHVDLTEPDRYTSKLTVEHTSGIQDVRVQYCLCSDGPSLFEKPRHFSYVRSLKWFGLNAARKLPPRSLAVLCAACSQPGINMDPDWESEPRDKWYVSSDMHSSTPRTATLDLASMTRKWTIKIFELRDAYNAARAKMLRLGLSQGDHNYQPLTRKDCEPFEVDHIQQKLGQKTKSIPWIWRDCAYREDTNLNKWQKEGMRFDNRYASTGPGPALAQCAVELLEAEMRRTQRHFAYFAAVWQDRAVISSTDQELDLPERGKAAFAARQSAMYRRLLCEAQALYPERLRLAI
ncbi:hypothetical protein NM688_g8716 [Phlebia brevispora]|uniref:Uncharacterized protein n=1 Tax=Phlebia brevispora TaxID=194682 RepID=A0ACC1RS91_9APHY|nr:hypothetical protein NM688_g8716 [Phlebia brevispora]